MYQNIAVDRQETGSKYRNFCLLTKHSTIGENKKKARLWIEGGFLDKAGFSYGTKWHLKTSSTKMLICKGEHTDYRTRKISGTIKRPIIDISGKNVPFAIGTDVEIQLIDNKLLIVEI